MANHKKPEHKLPVKQFAILEPIALTSVYPYLPAMIESFPNVKEADVGFWAGTASATFSIAQVFTAIPWGRASDRFGRKPIMLLGVFNTMVTSLIWGFSTNLWLALTMRALQGAMNGNVGILRTMVAELCPWKELQPRAFSIMPLIFSVGSVIGPAMGGALANPYNRSKDDPPDGPLLWRFPYALPNMVAAAFFLFGITTGILFLEETLASRKHRRDPGLVLGRKLAVLVDRVLHYVASNFLWMIGRAEKQTYQSPEHYSPVATDEETVTGVRTPPQTEKDEAPRYRDVLSKQTNICLLNYFLLAMHNTAFSQIVSVFLHHPRSGKGISEDLNSLFGFNKGLGMATSEIGILFMLNGFAAIFFQFVIFPPLARRYGVLACLRWVLHIVPFLYLIAPFTTLFNDQKIAQAAFFSVWLAITLCSTVSFPCSTIILTNTATSLKVLGTINGLATSIGAIGRATGPTAAGTLFTWGVKNVCLPAPFMLLFVMGVITWFPLYFMEEGAGFGDDDEEIEEDHEDYEEHYRQARLDADSDTDSVAPYQFSRNMSGRTSSSRTPRQTLSRTATGNMSLATEATGEEGDDELSPLLTRQSTRGSNRLSRYTSVESSVFGDSEAEDGNEPSTAPIRGTESGDESTPRRTPLRRRRSSAPVGFGQSLRRMSSNLGVSGSGYGTGSTMHG